jgi:hypothetical protein
LDVTKRQAERHRTAISEAPCWPLGSCCCYSPARHASTCRTRRNQPGAIAAFSSHDDSLSGIYVAGGTSLPALCAALAVLDAERSSPDANISDFGDAIWWAVTTMTTVGYGDHYPVTAAGRLVAFGLMIGGIALLGTVTVTLACWLVETVAAEKEQTEDLRLAITLTTSTCRSTRSRARLTMCPTTRLSGWGHFTP